MEFGILNLKKKYLAINRNHKLSVDFTVVRFTENPLVVTAPSFEVKLKFILKVYLVFVHESAMYMFLLYVLCFLNKMKWN